MNSRVKSLLSLAAVITLSAVSGCIVSKKEKVVDEKPDVVVERRDRDHYGSPDVQHERVIESERPVIVKDRIVEQH